LITAQQYDTGRPRRSSQGRFFYCEFQPVSILFLPADSVILSQALSLTKSDLESPLGAKGALRAGGESFS
jgi:hypothetical protein